MRLVVMFHRGQGVSLTAFLGIFQPPDLSGMGALQRGAIGIRATVVATADLLQKFIDLAIACGVFGVRAADTEFFRRKVSAVRDFAVRRFRRRLVTATEEQQYGGGHDPETRFHIPEV